MLSTSQLRGGGGPAGPRCLLRTAVCGLGRGAGVSGTWRIDFSEGWTEGWGLESLWLRSMVGGAWLRRRCWMRSLTLFEDSGACVWAPWCEGPVDEEREGWTGMFGLLY